MASTIPFAEALRRVLTAPCGRMAGESVALVRALGRHLHEPLVADVDWPETDRSAMDGFAVQAGAGVPAGTRRRVAGESLAGKPFDGAVPPDAAVRIMTGAVVPAGADAVVPVEQTSGFEGGCDGGEVEFRVAVRAGQNVRAAGSELRRGQQVAPAGRRIRAAEIGALAVLGRTEVAVCRRPHVAIVATGDEVVTVDRQPLPYQVRDSNSWALAAQVEECGAHAERLGVARDEPESLRSLLEHGLAGDVLLTIGGVSKGTHDLVHGTLQQLGVEPSFHGIELKPGKPTFFGLRTAGARTVSVFGLPGNPASCFTVFDLLVRPLLQRLLGGAPEPPTAVARMQGSWKPNARMQATPVKLHHRGGELVAEVLPPSPSGDPFGLVGGDAYALLPENRRPDELTHATVVGYAAGMPLP
jgi:molybdopterin molybdotransferase